MIKPQKNFYFKFTLIGIFFLSLLLDQLSKYWAQGMGWVVINSGISFALFSQIKISNFLLFTASILLVVILLILVKKFPESSFLSTIFMASAFSNLLDRIVFSGVRDWLPVPILGLKNNLADWLMFLVVIFYLLKNIKHANRNNF